MSSLYFMQMLTIYSHTYFHSQTHTQTYSHMNSIIIAGCTLKVYHEKKTKKLKNRNREQRYKKKRETNLFYLSQIECF